MKRFIATPEPILGEPTRPTIAQVRDCCYANASQIPCPLGGGHEGYLGALLPPAEYLVIPGTIAFVEPVHPGNILVANLVGTAAAIADQLRAHEERLRQYNEYDAVMQAIRKQLIESVEEKYIIRLRHRYSRYNAVHPRDIINHLIQNYGKLSAEDMNTNDQRMSEPWDTTDPFEVVAERMRECVELAAEAGRPISEPILMDRIIRIVAKTGEYTEELKTWHKRAALAQTWPLFQEYIIEAQRINWQLERIIREQGRQ